MPQKIVTITESGSGNVYNFGADAITYVVDNGSTRDVTVIQQNKGPVVITATETLAAIASAAGNLASPLVSSVTGSSISLNADRIILAEEDVANPASGIITITNNTNIAGDAFTIGSDTFTEGSEFAAGADDTAPELEVTAVNLAAAINSTSTVVTATVSGAVVTLESIVGQGGNAIVFTYTDGGSAGATVSGSGTLEDGVTVVHYEDDEQIGVKVSVDDSVAAVITAAANMISLTDSSNGIIAGYNVDKIRTVQDDVSGGSLVEINLFETVLTGKVFDETKAAVIAAVNGL